jgi:hypothetical protein
VDVMLRTPADALASCTRIAALGLLLVTCQWLWNWRLLRSHDLFSWHLLRTRRGFTQKGWTARVGDALLHFPQFVVVLVICAVAAGFLVVHPESAPVSPYVLTAIVVTTLLTHLRLFPYGATGADRMLFLIFGALWLLQLAPASTLAQQGCLWFLALQVTLSYLTSGVCKIVSADWRCGKVMSRILQNPYFVTERMARELRRHTNMPQWVSWGGMLWELTFPLFFIISWSWGGVFLLVGLLFHLLNAVILGLNTFVFAWLATYPALIYCRLQLDAYLSRY